MSDDFEDDDSARTGTRLIEHRAGALTPIPEGSNESMNTSSIPSLPDDIENLAAYLASDEDELQHFLNETKEMLSLPLEVAHKEDPPMSNLADIEERLPLWYLYSDDSESRRMCPMPISGYETYQDCELDFSRYADRILNLQED